MRAAHAIVFVATAVVASAGGSACLREGAPVVAPVEVTVEGADGGAAPLIVTAPPPAGRDRCTARLVAATIKTKEGCTLDERISHGAGALLYPCAGDGPVEAVFGEHRFEGRITGSAVALNLTTELDWEDGCHWETKQAIRGEWKRDGGAGPTATHPKLSWSYSEAPVSGTGCLGSCRANADIDIEDLPR